MNRISTRNSPGNNRAGVPFTTTDDDLSGVTSDKDHCFRCHETALALESIARRLINLEKNLKQEAEVARLNDILTPLLPDPAISKSPSTSTYSGHRQNPITGSAMIQRTDLDDILMPYLERSPYAPEDAMFDRIIAECQRIFPHETRQRVVSKIREWYRKRREYMTHRVYNYCNKHYRMQDGKQVISSLRTNDAMVDVIREECSIDVGDDEEARKYVIDRVASFFERRN